MKVYKATGSNTLEVEEREVSDGSLVKVRISSILPTLSDLDIFMGKTEIKYPRVPCHMATAVVSDDREEYGLKRGTKVMLNPYVNARENDGYAKSERYGVDKDGFLADFVALPIDNIIPFPDEVKENDALFLEIVAVALKTINSINLQKGEYVAIAGDSLLSNVIAQFVLYYQAIPMIIAKDERYIKLAEKCGIYYTINETTEDVVERVKIITGGRMADHTVLHAKRNATPKFLTSLTKNGGDATVTTLLSTCPILEIDVAEIADKNITLKGISDGSSEIISAVNVITQKQLKLQYFIDHTIPIADSASLFLEQTNSPEVYISAIIKA